MSNNFSISLELIYLMSWLLKNERNSLKEIINNAISKGLSEEIKNINHDDILKNNDIINDTVLDFLYFLEDSLLDNLKDNNINLNINETIQKLNSPKLDFNTVWISMLKAQAEKTHNKDNSLKDSNNLLYTELIKNWRPNKNEPVN